MNERGTKGEDRAAIYIARLGYEILERNYFCRFGEIDIIAQKDDILAFIEVKERSGRALYPGAQAVTVSKRRKIIKTASVYMSELEKDKAKDFQPRFDVLEITSRDGSYTVDYIEGAFDTSCMPYSSIV